MKSKRAKWIAGVVAFLIMWLGWGFNETANIINNIGWFGMIAAFIAWTESKKTRSEMLRMQREAAEWREHAHKLITELHRHNVPK